MHMLGELADYWLEKTPIVLLVEMRVFAFVEQCVVIYVRDAVYCDPSERCSVL